MDLFDKKEKLADLIEEYTSDESKESELIDYVKECYDDPDLKDIELFKNILGELDKYLKDLSRKELKQRVLLIRSYIE